jgi:hypothetical protein
LLPGVLRAEPRNCGEVQILGVVSVADQGLARQDELHAHGPPACLLLHLARRRCRRILAVIDVAAGSSHAHRFTMNR